MAADRVDRCIAGLVDAGLVIRTDIEPEGGGEAEIRYHASDAAVESREAVAAELRSRHPEPPEGLGALLVIHDANESPEGFDRDVLEHCLEQPPACLSHDAAAKAYQALSKQAWIFHSRHSNAPWQAPACTRNRADHRAPARDAADLPEDASRRAERVRLLRGPALAAICRAPTIPTPGRATETGELARVSALSSCRTPEAWHIACAICDWGVA